jgi:hypothetical protein
VGEGEVLKNNAEGGEETGEERGRSGMSFRLLSDVSGYCGGLGWVGVGGWPVMGGVGSLLAAAYTGWR